MLNPLYLFVCLFQNMNTYHFHHPQTWGHAARRNWVTMWPWQCPFFPETPQHMTPLPQPLGQKWWSKCTGSLETWSQAGSVKPHMSCAVAHGLGPNRTWCRSECFRTEVGGREGLEDMDVLKSFIIFKAFLVSWPFYFYSKIYTVAEVTLRSTVLYFFNNLLY